MTSMIDDSVGSFIAMIGGVWALCCRMVGQAYALLFLPVFSQSVIDEYIYPRLARLVKIKLLFMRS